MMSVTKALLAGALLISACYAQTTVRLEFEAASVKPSPQVAGGPISMFCRGGPGSADPGLFRCENFSLANLINWAYGLGANQLSAPDWVSRANFDINAKVPKGATYDEFRSMLQSMLVDRFKLEVHHETRESAEYRLTVAKGGSKLKPAASKPPADASGDAPPDPDAPKAFHRDAAGYPTFSKGAFGTSSTFDGRTTMYEPRMTMHWLATRLSGLVHATVNDATGVEGEYEITLHWILDPAPAAGSPDDVSGPTLVQALQKELGLRLEKTANGTKDVLVVDHAEKVPTGY